MTGYNNGKFLSEWIRTGRLSKEISFSGDNNRKGTIGFVLAFIGALLISGFVSERADAREKSRVVIVRSNSAVDADNRIAPEILKKMLEKYKTKKLTGNKKGLKTHVFSPVKFSISDRAHYLKTCPLRPAVH